MLIIAQKIKPNKIKLYRWAFDEIESYTLLKVTTEEAKELIKSEPSGWENKTIHGVNTYVRDVTPALNKVWFDMVARHKENNTSFRDVSKPFKKDVPGTSCLIRDVNTHTIKIAFRKPDQRYSLNLLPISDEVRELFFNDAHHSLYWKLEHKYGVSVEDTETYRKWSKFMNTTYLNSLQ